MHLSLPEWFLLLYFGFLCLQISSVCNLCPDTGVKGGHLFRLTCSVVLWGGRDIANKYCWHVWGVLMVDVPHWVCHIPRQLVLPGSTLFRLQVSQRGYCSKWALHFKHFPGQSHSGSRVFCKVTDPDGLCILCLPQVQATQATGCLVSTPSQVGHASYAPPWSQPLSFPGAPQGHSPGCAVCLL